MHTSYILSVWVHILAAMIWVGGMFLWVLVNMPVFRNPPFENLRIEFLVRAGKRFRLIGWSCLAILAITGSFNLYFRGVTFHTMMNEEFWLKNPFGKLAAEKLFIFLLIILMSILHDVYTGEKTLWITDSKKALRNKMGAKWTGMITMLLVLMLIWFAVRMVRGI